MEQIDSDDLIGALETIMEIFSEDIGPYAVQLAQQLANKYHALVTDDNDDEDEAEERFGGPGAHARVLMREGRRKAEDSRSPRPWADVLSRWRCCT